MLIFFNMMRNALFILGELSDLDIDWLVVSGELQRIESGFVLMKEGAHTDFLYLLLDGQLSVHTQHMPTQQISCLYPGEFVGEISFLDLRPLSATVTAQRKSALWAVPRKKIIDKLTQDIAFAARFYRAIGILLAYRLRNTNAKMATLSSRLASSSLAVESPQESSGLLESHVLDAHVLDAVSLAGQRFDFLVKKFLGRS